MKIGMVGLGKLGLPVALAIESMGHEVWGTDTSQEVLDSIELGELPYKEEGAQELLDSSSLNLGSVADVVGHSDIVFVAVQTPHEMQYEGISPLPDSRADFNYFWLRTAVADVAEAAQELEKSVILVVISTVLPGTMHREIYPLLNERTQIIYNPFFIAMGTTIRDFLTPEFILLGSDQATGSVPSAMDGLLEFYRTITDASWFHTDIRTAELIKVAYNTFIGMKIVFANTMMEICHKTGADVDDVTMALSLGTERLLSPKYLKGGMGDGGGCHPRDNIALSWLARELNLSHDFFEDIMKARQDQTEWLASLARECEVRTRLPVVILGKAFKSETDLTVGSPASLLNFYLGGVDQHDRHVDGKEEPLSFPAVYFIATKHPEYPKLHFPEGSVVIDPWGYIPDQRDVEVIRVGRRHSRES